MVRPQLAIVIFDSHESGGWKALYMSGVAELLEDVDEGIEIFSRRSVEQGLPVWTRGTSYLQRAIASTGRRRPSTLSSTRTISASRSA
jgi:hypothetical protein